MKNGNSYFFTLPFFPLQHCFLLFSPLMSTSLLSSCHVFLLSSERQMRNKREREPPGSCPHIIATPFISPSPHPLLLYPPSFCLPEWQLAASRVQWTCQPKCRHLPSDLRKGTFERDWGIQAVALLLVAQTHAALIHCALPMELCGL